MRLAMTDPVLRAGRTIVIVALAVGLPGCQIQRVPEPSPPSLTARWLPDCEAHSEAAYFSLRVPGNGAVQYYGGAQAREAGERSVRIPASRALELLRQAQQFSSRNRRQAWSKEAYGAYCLEVIVERGTTMTRSRRFIQSTARPRLARSLDALIRANQWVCPARGWNENITLERSGYCDDWDSRPTISLTIPDEVDCGGYHVFDLYDDGTIYYQAKHVTRVDHMWPTVVGDAYYRVPRATVMELINLVIGFRLTRDYISHSPPDADYASLVLKEARQLQEQLRIEAGIRLIPTDTVPCKAGPTPGPMVWLRYDRRPKE